MKDIRPFMFHAHYNWIADSGCTPYIIVNCLNDNVQVPEGFITEQGTIILNISMSSAENLSFDGNAVSFAASFNRVQQNVYVPFEAIMTIYAKEEPGAGTHLYNVMDDNIPTPSADELEEAVKIIRNVNALADEPDDVQLQIDVAERRENSGLALVQNEHSSTKSKQSKPRGHLTLVK